MGQIKDGPGKKDFPVNFHPSLCLVPHLNEQRETMGAGQAGKCTNRYNGLHTSGNPVQMSGKPKLSGQAKKPPAGFSFTRMVEDVSQSAFTAGVQAPLTYVAGQGPRPPGMVFTMSCTLRQISCLESVLSVVFLYSRHSSKARTSQSTFSVILT